MSMRVPSEASMIMDDIPRESSHLICVHAGYRQHAVHGPAYRKGARVSQRRRARVHYLGLRRHDRRPQHVALRGDVQRLDQEGRLAADAATDKGHIELRRQQLSLKIGVARYQRS
eukprot:scaffold58512_cov25-Prasinocladus_malaysianus.AAC.1